MNNNIFKFIALPVVLLSTILTGCNNSTPVRSDEITYRDVIIEDYRKNPPRHINPGDVGEDIMISRSYICCNDSFTIAIPNPITLCCEVQMTFFDDIVIIFNDTSDVPKVWKDHSFVYIDEAYQLGYYTREDILRIKEMHDSGENDFSILDQPYVEKEAE